MLLYAILILLLQIAFISYAYLKLKNENEKYILLKIIVISILGLYKLRINRFPIPIGFIVYFLFFFKPKSNTKPNHITAKHITDKQISALLVLIIFGIGITVPYLENIYFMRTRVVATGSISFNNVNISDKSLFKQCEAYSLRVTEFNESFNKGGIVQSRQLVIVGYNNSGGFVRYELNFDRNRYFIKAKKYSKYPEYTMAISYDTFKKQIKKLTLTDVKSLKKFDYYYSWYLGKRVIDTSTIKSITCTSDLIKVVKPSVSRGQWLATYAMKNISKERSGSVDSIFFMLMPLYGGI